MKAYMAITGILFSGQGQPPEIKIVMVDATTGALRTQIDIQTAYFAYAAYVQAFSDAGAAAYGSSRQDLSLVNRLVGITDQDEPIYAFAQVQSGGGLNFMRDLVVFAVSNTGAIRELAKDHVQMDAPAWIGGAPQVFLAAAGGDRAFFFSLDPTLANPTPGLVNLATYSLDGSFSQGRLNMPSGFVMNSGGLLLHADSGEDLWVVSNNGTSASDLYLVRRVGGNWQVVNQTQAIGANIPMSTAISMAASAGVTALDYVVGSTPSNDANGLAYDDYGSYAITSDALTSTGFTGSVTAYSVLVEAMGANASAGPASFVVRTRYPDPAFWTNLVGDVVATP